MSVSSRVLVEGDVKSGTFRLLLMLQRITDALWTILYIADLFGWLMRTSVRTGRNSFVFQFLPSSASQSRATTKRRAWAA
jgi:hypothetical protein